MNRHVPVTILAMYADSGNGATCDVELLDRRVWSLIV